MAKSSGCPGTLDPPQYSLLIVNGLTSRSLGNQGFEPSKKFGRQGHGIFGDVWCRSYPDQSRVLPLVGPGPCELGKGQGYQRVPLKELCKKRKQGTWPGPGVTRDVISLFGDASSRPCEKKLGLCLVLSAFSPALFTSSSSSVSFLRLLGSRHRATNVAPVAQRSDSIIVCN